MIDENSKAMRKQKSFVFDYVFDESDSNTDLYTTICKPLVDKLLKGFNSTIFAYGKNIFTQIYIINY